MSDLNNTEAKKAPSHVAYHVTERAAKKYWTRVGIAWEHTDKKGFNVLLECTPIDGRIALRIASEDITK